jgi:Fe-S cluster assembly ATP-binding protein
MLSIQNLYAKVEKNPILQGVNLEIAPGETCVLMGPNGSGKSTLAKAIMGHPSVDIEQGTISVDGKDITSEEVSERAKTGVFLAFQYPTEVPGVNFSNFLRLAYNAGKEKDKQLGVFQFRKILKQKAALLGISEEFLDRNLNEGLSGGEKKKSEILQLAVLEPKYAILDETDSGLDIDALRQVFSALAKLQEQNKKMGLLIITHYESIFDYISPDKIVVMKKGKITEQGGMEIAKDILAHGYEKYED